MAGRRVLAFLMVLVLLLAFGAFIAYFTLATLRLAESLWWNVWVSS